MSSDICTKCGMSLDMCVCNTPPQVESSVDEDSIRCAECNELFVPARPEITLCNKCSNEELEPEPVSSF